MQVSQHAGTAQQVAQRARPAHHPADTLFRLRAPKRPEQYARACFENMALVPLCGQVKTVLRKARPKRPYGTKRPDLLRAQPMFEKRATIDPRYSDQAQAIAVNKQLPLPV